MGASRAATAVEARDLTVRYGTVTAVDGVSLQATAGEIVGLLGPNGAGKTSVIRALTTIVPVHGGTATVAGDPSLRPGRNPGQHRRAPRVERLPRYANCPLVPPRAVQRVIEDNRAARLLASIGYDYVHLDTDEVTFAGAHHARQRPRGLKPARCRTS